MRAILQERVTGPVTTLGEWQPTGLENPGPGDWVEKVVKEEGGGGLKEQQWEWLEMRYRYLHDRKTVQERRLKQRKQSQRRNLRFRAG
jgi:hypothetical protein